MNTLAKTPLPEALAHLSMVITAIIYGVMVAAIVRGRRENSLFRSSYYSLFIVHAIVDFALFFYVILVYTPRKHNYFNLYTEDMKITAEVTFLVIVLLRCAVPLTHVVIAFNRFTVYMYPLTYNKVGPISDSASSEMWSSQLIFVLTIGVFGASFAIVLPFWLTSRAEIHFVIKEDGAHIIGAEFTSDMLFTTSITTALVVVSCAFFYGYALSKSWSLSSGAEKIERRLLVCALSSSLPFVFELVRVGLMYYGMKVGPIQLAIVTSAAWIYLEAATFFLQVAVQLLLNRPLRRRTLGMCYEMSVSRNVALSLHTMTAGKTVKQNAISTVAA